MSEGATIGSFRLRRVMEPKRCLMSALTVGFLRL